MTDQDSGRPAPTHDEEATGEIRIQASRDGERWADVNPLAAHDEEAVSEEERGAVLDRLFPTRLFNPASWDDVEEIFDALVRAERRVKELEKAYGAVFDDAAWWERKACDYHKDLDTARARLAELEKELADERERWEEWVKAAEAHFGHSLNLPGAK